MYAVRVAGRAVDRARVEAVAAVGVVGLPGLVGGLEQDVGVARVVAHDEHDVAAAAGVVADQVRDVHARDTASSAPSTTPTRPSCRSRSARSAASRSGTRAGSAAASLTACSPADHLPGTVALVVAQPQDVDVVVVAGVLILNCTVSPGFTLIDVAKPWIVGRPGAGDLPVAGRSPRQGVLAGDHAHAPAARTGRPPPLESSGRRTAGPDPQVQRLRRSRKSGADASLSFGARTRAGASRSLVVLPALISDY